ncbi:MAG: rod shape-determining protein MreC [Syntrophales bacterium]|nr:rod shape-determining protein MreC [Syntrophales bacterium]
MLFPKKNRPVIIISLVAVLTVVLLVYSARHPYESGFFRKLVLEMSAPLDYVFRTPSNAVSRVWQRYIFLVDLESENRRLKKENDQLTSQVVQYREAYQESLRLQKFLGLVDHAGYTTVPARVIGRDQKSVLKTVLINRGTSHGLNKDSPVITDRGVVGRVIETSWHVSRVLLLTDANSNIDAFIQSNRVQGILQGAGTTGCNLKYVAKTEDIKADDAVLTSGLDIIFPKGLLLGVVIRADKTDSGLFQRIEVVPAVDFSRLEEVLVLVIKQDNGKK